MRRTIYAAILGVISIASPGSAASVGLEAVPTTWRMEDYLGGTINIWLSGSSCANGGLVLAASVPEGVKDRFWSLVLTAKATGKVVGIYYDNATPSCTILHFYSKEQ